MKLSALYTPTILISSSVVVAWSNAVAHNTNPYGLTYDKIRGVNLGGWLLLERWINYELFETWTPNNKKIVDEFTFTKFLGSDAANRALTHHWDTWLTEKDIESLASYGINTVRIPFGFWIIEIQGHEPWVPGGIRYLKRAVKWCKKYGLRVMLDLHGAPGSQHGGQSSGRKGDVLFWENGFSGKNVQRALRVIEGLARIFSAAQYKDTVVYFDILNEPHIDDWELYSKFVKAAYKGIRRAERQNKKAVLATAVEFYPEGYKQGLKRLRGKMESSMTVVYPYWDGLLSPPEYFNTMTSIQIYGGFDDITDPTMKIPDACSWKEKLRKSKLPAIVGEWSLAISRNVSFPEDFNYREWCEAQMDAYEGGAGWIYWNFKHPANAKWGYLQGVEQGLIPPHAAKRERQC